MNGWGTGGDFEGGLLDAVEVEARAGAGFSVVSTFIKRKEGKGVGPDSIAGSTASPGVTGDFVPEDAGAGTGTGWIPSAISSSSSSSSSSSPSQIIVSHLTGVKEGIIGSVSSSTWTLAL